MLLLLLLFSHAMHSPSVITIFFSAFIIQNRTDRSVDRTLIVADYDGIIEVCTMQSKFLRRKNHRDNAQRKSTHTKCIITISLNLIYIFIHTTHKHTYKLENDRLNEKEKIEMGRERIYVVQRCIFVRMKMIVKRR